MKYVEELNSGDAFVVKDQSFVLTSDFKNNGARKAINLNDGMCKWFDANCMCEFIDLFMLDKNNNIIKIKTSDDKSKENTNIF
jgi:hypothetical protein